MTIEGLDPFRNPERTRRVQEFFAEVDALPEPTETIDEIIRRNQDAHLAPSHLERAKDVPHFGVELAGEVAGPFPSVVGCFS